MQGEESREVDRVIGGKWSSARGVKQDTEVLPIIQGSRSSPPPVKDWNKPQPCGRNSIGVSHQRESTTDPGKTGKYPGHDSGSKGDCGSSV